MVIGIVRVEVWVFRSIHDGKISKYPITFFVSHRLVHKSTSLYLVAVDRSTLPPRNQEQVAMVITIDSEIYPFYHPSAGGPQIRGESPEKPPGSGFPRGSLVILHLHVQFAQNGFDEQ